MSQPVAHTLEKRDDDQKPVEKKARKERKDKGVKRGPRQAKSDAAVN